MSQHTEGKSKKEKKDLMYWVKLVLLIAPLVGGGTWFGTTQWEDDDEMDKYEIQEIDAEQRDIRMEQDDKFIDTDQQIINEDEIEEDVENEGEDDDE